MTPDPAYGGTETNSSLPPTDKTVPSDPTYLPLDEYEIVQEVTVNGKSVLSSQETFNFNSAKNETLS